MAEERQTRLLVAAIATLIIVNAFLYFLAHDQTFVHIDAIAHVNKARGLFDNLTPGLRQLGTVWLPLPHLLMAPLAMIDPLWRNGAAGSLVSIVAFIGTSLFLFLTACEWTGSSTAGWVAFLLFALNPHMIYLFTTPENEPLLICCAAGAIYYLVRWSQHESWTDFALAALFTFAATLTRYEGWALAAAACVVVPIVARRDRLSSTILFAGAACAGPMLWMLFNLVYFDGATMFAVGTGSAQVNSTGKMFGTAGRVWDSCERYFVDVAYNLNPGVLWLGIGGLAISVVLLRQRNWRPTLVLVAACGSLFAFYVLNLFVNNIAILMPGLAPNDLESTYNVRYGSVMASTIPLFAALFVFFVWRQVQRRRAVALLMLAPLFLPDPIPAASQEGTQEQFTRNLFYKEAIHNQSFWMPPFIDVAEKLQADISANSDPNGLVLTNTRIVHVVVWATGIPMHRFLTEMHSPAWRLSLSNIDERARWAITEEGDDLWNARGKWLAKNWIEVATAKTDSTGRVHLYRKP
jgi:Dolichyl-phosphate-mannose-protein mannosyltransferase